MSDPLDILTSATAYLQNHQITSHGMDAPDHDPPRQRKRRRVALSCEQCRQRKVKCDRNEPCGACIIARISGCVYKDNNPGGATQAGGDTPSLSRSLQPIVPDPSNRAAGFPPSPAITQSPPGKSVASSLGQREPNKRTTGASNPYSENLGDLDSKPLKGVRGTFAKNRLYGESHWTSYLTTSSIAIEGIRDIAKEGFSDAFGQLGKCKALAREVKAQETPDEDKLRQNDWLLPSRTVADMLVDAYLRSIETLMQILDVQQFKTLYEQYWKDSESVPRGFGFSMLLIFANGAAVCADHGISRKNVIHWLYSASQWLGSPKAKMRTNLWSLRTHCLLLLARQLNGIDGKLTALSAGSLVATAMHMGLHVDPSHFAASQVPAEEQETRRRLWATVLELELESTMDSGGRPLLREDDYDCAPPSNIDDREKNTASCRNKILPMERFTQSSVQILLARSVPIRLKVVRFVNDFRPGARYEDALALSKELVEEMRRGSELIDVWRKASAPIAQFQIELYNIIMYRFLLALHYSYALKAKDEPLFYYSRKICLDASLAVLSPPVMQRDGDFYRLALHGRSVVQDVYTAAANFLCEYICAESANSAFLLPATGPSPNDNLIAALEAHVPLNLARIEIAETNVKSHLLLQCLIAFAKANRSGANIQENLRTAINLSLQDAHAALRSRLEGSSPASVEAQNMPAGEDMSLENLFNWLQGDDVFGSSDGDAWMNGLDWYIPNDGTMMDAVTAGASGMSD